jgi:hypothetical protein
VMLLCWGLGALPMLAFGLSTLLWVHGRGEPRRGRHGRRRDGHLGHAAAAPRTDAPARARVEPRLLRVARAHAGVDGAGRPRRRADRDPATFVGRGGGAPRARGERRCWPGACPRDELAHPLDRAAAAHTVGQARAPSAPRSPP